MCLGFQESKISIQCTWSEAITRNANKKRIRPNRMIPLPLEHGAPFDKLATEEACSGVPNGPTNG